MKGVVKMSFARVFALVAVVALAGCQGEGEDGASGQAGAGIQSAGPEAEKVANRAVLSWSAPGTRVNGDGLAMGELDSYIIRYGQSREELELEVEVGNAAEQAHMEHVISELGAGTWYFTIQVRDAQGLLSEPSNVVSKTI